MDLGTNGKTVPSNIITWILSARHLAKNSADYYLLTNTSVYVFRSEMGRAAGPSQLDCDGSRIKVEALKLASFGQQLLHED